MTEREAARLRAFENREKKALISSMFDGNWSVFERVAALANEPFLAPVICSERFALPSKPKLRCRNSPPRR